MSTLSLEDARRIFGRDLIEPTPLAAILGLELDPEWTKGPIPLSADVAAAGHDAGCLLLFRHDTLADGTPLSLGTLLDRTVKAAHPAIRFRGEEPWFADDTRICAETPERGWALATPQPWPGTSNQTYEKAGGVLQARAAGAPWRRRRSVEIALDCFAVFAARGERLLEHAWDWSSTQSSDGGLVNVGGFSGDGLDVLSYSRAVKHGALGVCPTLVGHSRR